MCIVTVFGVSIHEQNVLSIPPPIASRLEHVAHCPVHFGLGVGFVNVVVDGHGVVVGA